MKITIIAVGKLKEKYWKDACAEYIKRLGAFTKVNIIEVPDASLKNTSGSEAIKIEASDIISKLDKFNSSDVHVFSLCIDGINWSSAQFASRIESIQTRGKSHIVFIIGGSSGLDHDVIVRSQGKISFGKITLPHNLARVVLLEQIYRAFMINTGRTYHK